MTLKIFLTGVTGYVGGDALVEISSVFPNAQVTVLVRDQNKAARVKRQFPEVHVVLGDLDSGNAIEEESAKADFVIHTADSADHLRAARSIGRGILKGHSKDRPGHWIHIGGAGVVTFHDEKAGRYGQAPLPENAYDDWEGIERILTIPADAFHRDVDMEVQKWASEHGDIVKSAILCPPTIYGTGRGPVNQQSRQVNLLCRMTLQDKQAPILGAGLTRHNNVHIRDLSNAIVTLLSAHLSGTQNLWGREAYYFVEGGSHEWGDVSRAVARAAKAKGYIASEELKPVDLEAAIKTKNYELLSWGLNAVTIGKRAGELFGWKPKEASLLATVPEILDAEAARLGF